MLGTTRVNSGQTRKAVFGSQVGYPDESPALAIDCTVLDKEIAVLPPNFKIVRRVLSRRDKILDRPVRKPAVCDNDAKLAWFSDLKFDGGLQPAVFRKPNHDSGLVVLMAWTHCDVRADRALGADLGLEQMPIARPETIMRSLPEIGLAVRFDPEALSGLFNPPVGGRIEPGKQRIQGLSGGVIGEIHNGHRRTSSHNEDVRTRRAPANQ